MEVFKPNMDIVALHRHWLHADAIKEVLFSKKKIEKDIPLEICKMGIDWSSILRLEVYYALLFVVIEGYKNLKIQNNEIDLLLEENEYVDSLRIFRNGIFHFQKEPISKKVLQFLEMEESEIWIKKINKSFKKYFEEELQIDNIFKMIGSKSIRNIKRLFYNKFRLFFKHKKKA